MSEILWTPLEERIENSALAKFARAYGFDPSDYSSLHRWSVSRLGEFWEAVWDFCGIEGRKGEIPFVPDETAWMTGARYFPEAELNLAENYLKGNGDEIAVFSMDEAGNYREISRSELRSAVSRIANGLQDAGVEPGDRVAGILPNDGDALAALLATVGIGAVWTSCSPDFGPAAITDRIGQVAPKVLFATPRFRYGLRNHDIGARVAEVVQRIESIEHLVVSGETKAPDTERVAISALEEFGSNRPCVFARFPFNHPAYILYTSGTTGAPKAIVHRTGGILLQHLKEHVLHGDVHSGDRVVWYTNTAWMMYHWNVSALAAGAAIGLYDGAPILKGQSGLDPSPLWNLAEKARVTHLGVSPKYMSVLASENYRPRDRYCLESLRMMLACGAPVLSPLFDWAYDAVKKDMCFASISGGTEILGSFLIGSPIHPVRRGQLTVPALGHAVAVMDDRNAPLVGKRGDLVCTEPFPSMPLAFWGENGDHRFRDAYFSDRKEIWTHGDIAELTVAGGGYVHGRADSTMNPGGVRIGSSEIYAVCQSFGELDDFLACGIRSEDDEEVVLFLKPKPDVAITDELAAEIRRKIRADASPRHVPARIYQVGDIPYTLNGKKVEAAARAALGGGAVKNLSSLANPECLEQFRRLDDDSALY